MYNPQAVIHNLSKANGKGKKKEFLSELLQSSFRVPHSNFQTQAKK
jgi:hypothetical protein